MSQKQKEYWGNTYICWFGHGPQRWLDNKNAISYVSTRADGFTAKAPGANSNKLEF